MREPDYKDLHPLGVHYFRVPRERWELMLVRVRQLGADAVSTPVPWSWHEPRDGAFDLTGITHPMRDVTDFLETCQAMGVRLILQASPYLGAGLLGGGVPGWLLKERPEICALGPDSRPHRDPDTGVAPPSPEHPTYLKYVERWYRELSDVLADWQAPDGPILALRAGHPILGSAEPHAGVIPADWDYNPHVVDVQWPVWLRQQYVGIEALNAAWKTGYRSFSDVAFPRQPTAPESARHGEDATRFVAYATTHAAETHTRLLAEMGWTIPIVSTADAPPAGAPTHITQVDPDPPRLGTGVRWAMDAPLRGDGSPRRRFWAVKEVLLGMEQGVKASEGVTLVTGAESRRVRLPRPAGDYSMYRLLLDGQLLEAPGRRRGDALLLDYVAEDEAGPSDMCIVLEGPAAPLTGFLRAYLLSLLMGRALSLRQAGSMCQALAEALSGVTPATEREKKQSGADDLQAAERSLVEARQAARRAAASLGRLERLASQVRGEIPSAAAPTPPERSAFSAQELARLGSVRETCAGIAPTLMEAARSITALCQSGESGGESLTIPVYRSALDQAQATAREAEATLSQALAGLRAELAAGALPPAAWAVQDWLTRVLQGLTADWLD